MMGKVIIDNLLNSIKFVTNKNNYMFGIEPNILKINIYIGNY
jgi:hypothetical protein